MLKAGTWSSQSTFSAFYFWDVTHRYRYFFNRAYGGSSTGSIIHKVFLLRCSNSHSSHFRLVCDCFLVDPISTGCSASSHSSTLFFYLDQRELQKPYTQETLISVVVVTVLISWRLDFWIARFFQMAPSVILQSVPPSDASP